MEQTDIHARIIASFRARSQSYYEDNYVRGKDSNRQRRLAFVQNWLKENIQPSMNILEVGAGPAVFSEGIRDLGAHYTAVDLSWDNLKAGKKRVKALAAVVADATKLPLQSDYFDGAISLGCLEYIPQMNIAIQELGRLVKPSGLVIASFANKASPSRWLEEGLILPLADLKKKLFTNGIPRYPRFLSSATRVKEQFTAAGLHIEKLEFINSGLWGYPLSNLSVLQNLEESLVRKVAALRKISSEFLVLARRVQ